MKIWQNEQWRSLDMIHDYFGTPAFQFGFGVFETILVQDGRPVDLEEHFQRLFRSITQLDAVPNCSIDMQHLLATVLQSLSQCKEEKEVLKIIAYRMEDQWRPLILMRPYLYVRQDYVRGFSLKQSSILRNAKSLLVYYKTLNYLENYLERQKARREGYNEAFFLNTEGIITECTTANLFIIHKGELITSPVQAGLLPGIARLKLLEKAKALGLVAKEIPICPMMLREADMVLLTNALCGVMPVAKVEDRSYSFSLSMVEQMNEVLGRSI